MPRYFFDLSDGCAIHDADGRELPNDDAAQRHAMILAAETATSEEALEAGEAAVVVTVRSADRRMVAVVSLVIDVAQH